MRQNNKSQSWAIQQSRRAGAVQFSNYIRSQVQKAKKADEKATKKTK